MIPRADMLRAAEIIAGADEIVIACHIGPDGDALGTSLGLAIAAQDAGKDVMVSFEGAISRELVFLQSDLIVTPNKVPAEPKLMISVDTAGPDRLGVLRPHAEKAETLIVVDHHATNEGFGDIDLIDGGAAASAQVALPLILAAGWKVGPEAATALHTALVTDTGRFQYSYTSPTTMKTAGQLLAAGAKPEEIGRELYETAPFGYLKVLGQVLGRAELDPRNKLVWSSLLQSDLRDAEIESSATDGVIDVLRLPEESDVCVLLKEQDDGSTKVSLRSRGRVDVGTIAQQLGGGGHHNAAGCEIAKPPKDAIEDIRRLLESS
ncbi:MAG: bifunctional oligoribonuclease/PAP phosphatase NrnA [Acidimicrobiia bacterium]|nr:bifunctional oligoribonuclease/PAP phosphatase NrnA [Acidimicrobiia bacterium]